MNKFSYYVFDGARKRQYFYTNYGFVVGRDINHVFREIRAILPSKDGAKL